MINFGRGKKISYDQIEEIEKKIGAKFCKQYVNFIIDHNGSHPERNFFIISERETSCIRVFFPLDEIPSIISAVNDKKVEKEFFPFAEGSGGGIFLMKKNGGAGVFYYDPDYLGDYAVTKVSDDILSFLENIKKDNAEVSLGENQVKSVVIKPGFFDRIDKKYIEDK